MGKRILIITYYWPPSGGSGVQRWLKFTKYLCQSGWEPVIYTPKNPEYPAIDHSLRDDVPSGLTVLKTKIWEPYSFYKILSGKKPSERISAGFLKTNKGSGTIEKISRWIRGNLFIPDARKFWVKPSIRFLSEYLKQHPVDYIISTGPPHSMHLIALALKQQFTIPWVADFRDPWTQIDFYKELKLTKRSDRKHHTLELDVLQNADHILVIGKNMADEFQKIHSRRYEVIPNGFDPEDIDLHEKIPLDEKFSIAHIGSLTPARNCKMLWKILGFLVESNKDFARDLEINLIGEIDYSVWENIKNNGLESYIKKVPYLPHNEVIRFQKRSQVLLLLVNQSPNAKGILTGKIFEYLAAGRPILAIGPPDGDLAEVMKETEAGKIIDFKDAKTMEDTLLNYYISYKSNNLSVTVKNLTNYSRMELTRKLTGLFENKAQIFQSSNIQEI